MLSAHIFRILKRIWSKPALKLDFILDNILDISIGHVGPIKIKLEIGDRKLSIGRKQKFY